MRATGKVRPALTDWEVAFFLSPRPPDGEGRKGGTSCTVPASRTKITKNGIARKEVTIKN